MDIQYRFPWGTDTIETIYNHGKGPVEELQTWMDRGGEECRRNLSGSADNYSQTNADVVERQMQVVDLRVGKKCLSRFSCFNILKNITILCSIGIVNHSAVIDSCFE